MSSLHVSLNMAVTSLPANYFERVWDTRKKEKKSRKKYTYQESHIQLYVDFMNSENKC